MTRFVIVILSLVFVFSGAANADTLADVKAKGFVQCGVNQGLPGFAVKDDQGKWKGLDIDFCRALAAAIFADPAKVKYTPLSAKERFTALQSGDIDVLSRNTTWTATRDISLGLSFVGVIFYDGQGFMVRKNLKLKTARGLGGAVICANAGTTTELNVGDFFRHANLKYELLTFEKSDEVLQAYEKGRCDAYTTDRSGLSAQRLKLAKPEAHIILPETISKEPLGPVVRVGDEAWFKVVRWTLFALINAEELGVSSTNVEAMLKSKNPKVKRLLGVEGDFGKKLKLDNQWAYNIVKHIGNYGEIYARTVGPKTPINIPRGRNDLWTKGGLHYAPPVR